MSKDNQEVELKLTVLDPAALAEPLSWRNLAGYLLQPRMPQRIRDRNWDTAAGAGMLAQSHLSLRLRQIDELDLFTLKGAATVSDGLFRRSELEVPADLNGWMALRAELQSHGVPLPELAAGPTNPAQWLADAGFEIVQDRETLRRRLFALDGEEPVAELALDTTTFHLTAIDVTIREIEIESLTERSADVLSLGQVLRERLVGRVQPSAEGKYAAGLAFKARLDGFSPGSASGESR
jgi:inorganic triphosphatase YgiF